MNITWKQIKAEIDGLPKTEKTLALKKMADGFEKELREKYAWGKFWLDIYPEKAYPKETIPQKPDDIKSKSGALNYCLLVCRKNLTTLGCAVECEIRKKWQIPPHGEKYYE